MLRKASSKHAKERVEPIRASAVAVRRAVVEEVAVELDARRRAVAGATPTLTSSIDAIKRRQKTSTNNNIINKNLVGADAKAATVAIAQRSAVDRRRALVAAKALRTVRDRESMHQTDGLRRRVALGAAVDVDVRVVVVAHRKQRRPIEVRRGGVVVEQLCAR